MNRPAVERRVRVARRLMAMEPEEIAARARERWRLPAPPDPPPWRPPAAAALARQLEHGFLFGPESGLGRLEVWRRERPEDAVRLIEAARRGLEAWDVFGVPVRLEPGAVNWQDGDLRWVWELNRHQYLFTFARAYGLTGEPVFAERVGALVAGWRKANPYGQGPNWSSALEVAVRALSWLWALPLVWPPPLLREWAAGLYEHYYYLANHLSLYTDPTNHLIGEAAALWMLSVALPGLPGAARYERQSMEVLAREVARQVSADGVSREQSTGYQRFVLDFCRQVVQVAARAGRMLPPVIGERTWAMGRFLALLGGDDAPAIGDSDDGRAVPLPQLGDEEAWWLDWAEEPPAAPGGFPEGGYCYFAAGDLALLFDVGPLGLWPNASHGHADALSIQVKVGERWVLGDPGTGAYAANRQVREALRSTAAHNTVTVDGAGQADPLDTFKWLQPVHTRLLESRSDARHDYARAMHDGYLRLGRPVIHSRSVLFVRPPARDAGWMVQDRLDGTGRRRCAAYFHFPPEARLSAEGPAAVRAVLPGGEGLRLEFSQGAWRAETGLWSRRFGRWENAPVVVLEQEADLPLLWCTFLSPLR